MGVFASRQSVNCVIVSSGFVGLPSFPQGKRCWLLAVFGENLQLTWNVVASS